MTISEHRFDSADALASRLAEEIGLELSDAVTARGVASLVVSGGRTPRQLFENLSQISLPWEKIYLTLADERWVDSTSADSNEAMLRDSLLQGAAAKAHFVPLKNAAADPAQGQSACETKLRELPWPLDRVILGMGDDGHTASLFPGVAGRALDSDCAELCLPIIPALAPYERMSLTASAILNSRNISLHFTGQGKWQVYRDALNAGPLDQLPVRVVLHQDIVPVAVYWSP